MCDYSLHLVASRPARVGDKLVSAKFAGTTTRGFASVDQERVAVCLLPGSEVAFENEVRYETGAIFRPRAKTGHRVARFTQVEKQKFNTHHDALEFPDGTIVLLTKLCEGQLATVLQLPAVVRLHADEDERIKEHATRLTTEIEMGAAVQVDT